MHARNNIVGIKGGRGWLAGLHLLDLVLNLFLESGAWVGGKRFDHIYIYILENINQFEGEFFN